MNLQLALTLCTAWHAGALLFWFGALGLARVAGLAHFHAAPAALRWAGAAALATGIACPMLQTGVVFEDSAAALDAQRLAVVLAQTSFGRIWLGHDVLLLVAGGVGLLAPARTGRVARLLYLLFVGAALASLALLGHAAGVAGGVGWLQQGVLAVHLLLAGAWVGTLPLLWQAARDLPAAQLAAGLRRYSALGVGLVALVLATGAASAWWRTGSVAALVDGDYARWLAGKIGLVGLMGAAALRNRNHYTPALEASQTSAGALAVRIGLRRNLAVEILLGAGVVLLAACLGAAEAAR